MMQVAPRGRFKKKPEVEEWFLETHTWTLALITDI